MSIFGAALRAIFPDCCEVCGRALTDGESLLCVTCDMMMPRTDYHLHNFSDIHRRLAAPRLPVEKAAVYFHYFRDNEYAELIKRAKYNERPEINRILGERFARELLATGFFDDMDLLMPMPLYKWKLWRRGFNQADEICRGISSVTSLPIADNLLTRRHSTQTRKSSIQRQSNVSGLAHVIHPEELTGKHILVVDDVITTGSTMLDAITALHNSVTGVRLSVLSLGAAKLS